MLGFPAMTFEAIILAGYDPGSLPMLGILGLSALLTIFCFEKGVKP